ncbi:unnamed protein product, partial [Tuber aestivum]
DRPNHSKEQTSGQTDGGSTATTIRIKPAHDQSTRVLYHTTPAQYRSIAATTPSRPSNQNSLKTNTVINSNPVDTLLDPSIKKLQPHLTNLTHPVSQSTSPDVRLLVQYKYSSMSVGGGEGKNYICQSVSRLPSPPVPT